MWQMVRSYLVSLGELFHTIDSSWVRVVLQLVLLLAVSAVSYWVVRLGYRWARVASVRRGRNRVKRLILHTPLIPRILQVVPLIVGGALVHTIFREGSMAQQILLMLTNVYFIFICANVFAALMTFIYELNNLRNGVSASPQKGLFQILSLVGYVFAAVAIVAVLSGRNPAYILSGMTALSAVFMLVFKDSILGFTAGITLAGNGLVKIGDWIEVPDANADGDVIDIALTTVRVRNWDKTITTVPAYNLIANPFKNWRGMSESGGRRIKRSIHIDLNSVAFADEGMLERWREIDLIRDYLAGKLREIRTYNSEHPSSKMSIANARNLTNIGTFRAYCNAYLRAHPHIHKDMTLLVRQLQPTERGIPLEIYCFTNTTAWLPYENIQSDIFDHFMAILPTFGLACFQVTSAKSVQDFAASFAPRGLVAVSQPE